MAKQKEPSKSATSRSARLVSVQTLYGVLHTGDSMREAAADVMARADKLEVHGEPLVEPNRALLQKILIGVDEHKSNLNDMINANLKKAEIELLLRSILLCGAFELMAHHDIDAPIIINDYVDVAHGFYEDGQAKLINGVLDTLSKSLRD